LEYNPLERWIVLKSFSQLEQDRMLALKGVGRTVICRLEQLGFFELSQLADKDPLFITKQISDMMGSTCWHNSPLARSAIRQIVDLARRD
jgi:predicted DNA-binding ribbon-helix-helix protein